MLARKRVISGASTLLTLSSLLIVTAFYSLPGNVLSLREGQAPRELSVLLAPQGWGFFTRDPTENEIIAYSVIQNQSNNSYLLDINRTSQSSPFAWGGVRRVQRAQGPELAIIVHQVEEWEECSNSSVGEQCRIQAIHNAPQLVTNTSPVPSVCGNTVVTLSKVVPWEYRENYSEQRYDTHVVHLNVAC